MERRKFLKTIGKLSLIPIAAGMPEVKAKDKDLHFPKDGKDVVGVYARIDNKMYNGYLDFDPNDPSITLDKKIEHHTEALGMSMARRMHRAYRTDTFLRRIGKLPFPD